MNAWTVSISLSGPGLISAADPDHLHPINFQHFFCPSRHSWDSSVGATEKLSRLRRTERTVMKAGTGWKRTTEALQNGGPRGANENRDWVRKDPMARGLAAQLPHWHQALQSSICGREDYSPYFWRPDFFFS